MKRNNLFPILITLLVGLVFQLFIGDYKDEHDFASQTAVILGGTIGFFLIVLVIPIIISVILLIINKRFPAQVFNNATYLILVFVTTIMFLFTPKSYQGDKIEEFRNKIKNECIQTTKAVFEGIEIENKNEQIIKSENYCNCLYNKLTKNDLERVFSGDLKLPELLNLEYKVQKDECYNQYFGEKNKNQELFETDIEKLTFWSSRISTYYLTTYGESRGDILSDMIGCLEPYIKEKHIKELINWERDELTSTELFVIHPELKEKVEDCYKNSRDE